MQTTEAVKLFDYLYWARDAVLGAAAELSSDEFTSTDSVTDRDLRATLVHELDVEWSWRERLKGADWEEWGDDADLSAGDYPTLESLRDHWMRAEDPLPLWYYVMHLVSHGIQQLSGAAVLRRGPTTRPATSVSSNSHATVWTTARRAGRNKLMVTWHGNRGTLSGATPSLGITSRQHERSSHGLTARWLAEAA